MNGILEQKRKENKIAAQNKKADTDNDKTTMINDNLARLTMRNSVLYNFNPNILPINTEKELNQLYNSLDPDKPQISNKNLNHEAEQLKRGINADVKTPHTRGKSMFEKLSTGGASNKKSSIEARSKLSTGHQRITSGYNRDKVTTRAFSSNHNKDDEYANIITDEKEKNLISTKTAFYKPTEKSNEVEQKKKYLNDLFNDDFLKDTQKEIELELESINAKTCTRYALI